MNEPYCTSIPKNSFSFPIRSKTILERGRITCFRVIPSANEPHAVAAGAKARR